MSLLFQHGSGKNAYDPYMGHTNGKELIPSEKFLSKNKTEHHDITEIV